MRPQAEETGWIFIFLNGTPPVSYSLSLIHSYARVTPKKLFEDMDRLIEATVDLKLVL